MKQRRPPGLGTRAELGTMVGLSALAPERALLGSWIVSEPRGIPDHFRGHEGTVLPARVPKQLSLGPPLLQGWMAIAGVRTWAEGWGQEQYAKAHSLSSLTVSPPVPC